MQKDIYVHPFRIVIQVPLEIHLISHQYGLSNPCWNNFSHCVPHKESLLCSCLSGACCYHSFFTVLVWYCSPKWLDQWFVAEGKWSATFKIFRTSGWPLTCSDLKVGSIEGRVGVHHVDESQQGKNFTFKCHRDGNDIYSVNSLNFHPVRPLPQMFCFNRFIILNKIL